VLYPTLLNCLSCALLGVAACVWLAVRPNARVPWIGARGIVFLFWMSALVLAVSEGFLDRDWQHMFWMAQGSTVSLFVVSGTLLVSVWPDDGVLRSEQNGAPTRSRPARFNSAWWFFAMMSSLALLPLLQIAWFDSEPDGRNLGIPIRRVIELAHWGFGGPLPECLSPITDAEIARGVGHLPREVTVPFGTLLIGAWLWIAFCAIAIVGRWMPAGNLRRGFLLLAPFFLGVTSFIADIGHGDSQFAPSFFWPGSALKSGIWRSEPVVMKSFGPVMLAALLCALLLALLVRFWPRSKRTTNDATSAIRTSNPGQPR
jgi:hypothetical protein